MDSGQTIEIRIEDMLDDGRAFGRCEGLAVFVSGGCEKRSGSVFKGAVPGDLARVEITKEKKNSAEATLLEIIEESPDRTEAECPYFGKCGGCTLQEMSYDAQLRIKTGQVRAKLSRLGGLTEPKVNDCIAADNLKYHRNKAVFAVGPHGEVGFLKGKSHFVMDIDDCLLQSDAAMVCADALRAFLKMPEHKRLAYRVIKQLTVRSSFSTGEVMAVIESGKKEIEGLDLLIGMLDDAVNEADEFWSLESVALIHKGKCHIVAGKPVIKEEIITEDGRCINYEISPQSFYQVNPEQMQKLYDKAAQYADLKGGEIVLDLYCGAGTIGIWLLEELRKKDEEAFDKTKVIGIESVKPAVLDANRNSVINGMVNTRYFCGKAEEELPGMRIEKADEEILDPPRAGCGEALLAAVAAAQPDRIVYVSCDPGTLARDIKYLTANGYDFIEATPIDQFPWTSHIEVVAKIQKL